jgi:hypothetical protein
VDAKDQPQPSSPPPARRVKAIRLNDLIPKKDVKGQGGAVFGSIPAKPKRKGGGTISHGSGGGTGKV